MYLLRTTLILFICFLIFTVSYGKNDKTIHQLLLSIGQIEAEILMYKKLKNLHLVSIGKNSNIYTFVLENQKVKLKQSGYIPQITGSKIIIGDTVYDLKKKSIVTKDHSKEEKLFLEEKDKKWYLYIREKNRKKLRFKSKYRPIIFQHLKEPVMIIPKENKIETYYIKPPKYYPRIIKRIPLFKNYSYESFLCNQNLYILERSSKSKNAFLFIFDLKTKKLTKKLKIKKWIYQISGCGTEGIVLSAQEKFYILSSSGTIIQAKRIKVPLKQKNLETKTIKFTDLKNVWFLDKYLVVKTKDKILLFDKNLELLKQLNQKISGEHTFFKIKDNIYALIKENKNLCLFSLLEERNLFCKQVNSNVQYTLSEDGLLLLDTRKHTFYSYNLDGKLITQEKIPPVNVFALTKYGVLYVKENLIHLKPDGDFEIYEIKPLKIKNMGKYILFYTESGNHFFNGKKLVSPGKQCEPFENFRLCEEGFFNLYSIYPKKLKFSFIERPICSTSNYFIFLDSIENKKIIKLYSKNKNKLENYFSLPPDTTGFTCWENRILIINPDRLQIVDLSK